MKILSDVYYRKNLGVPYLSLIFLASCLLVSVSSYFFPELAKVFGGIRPINYPWQYITLVFEHGFGKIPLLFHLICNGIVISVFGVMSERLLGTKKFFIFTIVTAVAFYFQIHFILNDWQGMNGASGVIWGYSVIVFYVVNCSFKNNKDRLLKDPMFYFISFILLIIWVVITVIDISVYSKISYGLIAHFVSMLVGVIFVFIWKDDIKTRINEILKMNNPEKISNSFLDKVIIKCSLLIPVFILVILFLSFTGVLSRHVVSLEVTSIMPNGNSVEDINKANRKIRINFSSPMKKEVRKSSLYSISEKEYSKRLFMKINWIDNKTMIINFNREIYKDEGIKVILAGFSNSKGVSSNEKIILKYGYDKHITE